MLCDKGESRHYNIACVLDQCNLCGFARRASSCPIEIQRSQRVFHFKTLQKVTVDTENGSKKIMSEVSKPVRFGDFMQATHEEWKAFIVHDFVARWQGDLYRDMIMGEHDEMLPNGVELWISDYIEKNSTFSALELQQDYYHKTQVAIFIVLVIRHRGKGEHVMPSEVSP
jgi:hypothetical protein